VGNHASYWTVNRVSAIQSRTAIVDFLLMFLNVRIHHAVTEEEVADIRAWLARILAA
jgi:hypothetical protein